LLNGNTLEEERFFIAQETKHRELFTDLAPVAYTVQLIEDGNRNRRWDGGDYFSGRQPERVFSKKLEALRPNWQSEFSFSVPVETARSQRN
jgi:hypothetical protein